MTMVPFLTLHQSHKSHACSDHKWMMMTLHKPYKYTHAQNEITYHNTVPSLQEWVLTFRYIALVVGGLVGDNACFGAIVLYPGHFLGSHLSPLGVDWAETLVARPHRLPPPDWHRNSDTSGVSVPFRGSSLLDCWCIVVSRVYRFSQLKWTTILRRQFLTSCTLYVTSDRRLTTAKGPDHGRYSFLDFPLGTCGNRTHT